MNSEIIDEVARVLMYKGPDFQSLLEESVNEGKEVEIEEIENLKILKAAFNTAYNKRIIDIFTFNESYELVRHELQVNQTLRVIFDKYEEASTLLNKLPESNSVAC